MITETKIKDEVIMYNIPDEMPKFADRFSIERYSAREKYIKDGMFGFVSWKWVNPFVEWIGERKCLEVMAGRGILSHALRQNGIDVISTDDFSWATNNSNEMFDDWKKPYTEVLDMDAVDSVERYGKEIDILIMSWAYMDDTAYRVIEKLYEVNHSAVIVSIGEGCGGCTADDSFFECFDEIDDEKFGEVIRNFERWEGVYDRPRLGRFNSEKEDW